MERDERRALFARLMAEPTTLAALIDHLPEPEAVTLLKLWRAARFGPAPDSAEAAPKPEAEERGREV